MTSESRACVAVCDGADWVTAYSPYVSRVRSGVEPSPALDMFRGGVSETGVAIGAHMRYVRRRRLHTELVRALVSVEAGALTASPRRWSHTVLGRLFHRGADIEVGSPPRW